NARTNAGQVFLDNIGIAGCETPVNLCPSPTNFQVNFIEIDSAHIFWETPTNIILSHLVEYKLVGDTAVVSTSTQDRFPFLEFTDYLPGADYEMTIRTVCGENSISQANTFFFTTPTCENPDFIEADTITQNSAYIFWNGVLGVDGYELVGIKTLTNEEVLRVELANTVQTYFVDNLDPGTNYTFTIQSVCEGVRLLGLSTGFVTDCTTQLPSIRAEATANRAEFFLEDIPPGDNRYIFEYRELGDLSWSSININYRISFVVENLVVNTTYEYRLARRCGDEVFAFSGISDFTTVPCQAPTGLYADPYSDSLVILRWDEMGDVPGFWLALREQGAANF
ncbi:MAG: fibronectin type III domain-containing protein, partial [Bacteroidota bacterium]